MVALQYCTTQYAVCSRMCVVTGRNTICTLQYATNYTGLAVARHRETGVRWREGMRGCWILAFGGVLVSYLGQRVSLPLLRLPGLLDCG